MPYSRSSSRKSFESRIGALLAEANTAQKLSKSHPGIRDMVFQCAIFQTSAALEEYLKLLIEGWAFSLKQHNLNKSLPDLPRGFLVSRRLQRHFAQFAYTGDEAQLLKSIPKEYQAWPIFDDRAPLPAYFDGKLLHEKSAYPSFKNLKRLFFRVGIDQFEAKMNRLINGDMETLVEGFQSIRTALAHSAPPALTILDVKKNLRDITKLVSAIDRLFYKHVVENGGSSCWI
ncbi:HEPN domain-containing protein [Bradyrhizobium sp. HKCCYLR1023]|uniref:HEPN domain-containing protein n=1 Tax=Bradyrhizobium TaxID=374 RepID=UPI003EB6A4CB